MQEEEELVFSSPEEDKLAGWMRTGTALLSVGRREWREW